MMKALETLRTFLYRNLVASLSGRLLFFTTMFVLLAEMVIYIPSAARHYHDLLANRLANAQTAVLNLDELEASAISERLRSELLTNAGVRHVILRRDNTRALTLGEDVLPVPDVEVDLRAIWWPELIWRGLDCMMSSQPRVLRVIGYPRVGGGDVIEILIDEVPIRTDLVGFTERLFSLSLVIAFITSGLVFFSLYVLFVLPMKRVSLSMQRFQEKPGDASRIIQPSGRSDEIGQAERVLAAMQAELHLALRQREHLVALGTAVAKIQHDLRNILANAQLASDRLAESKDPTVQALAPRLIQSMDRAIALATNTLRYGKADGPPPQARRVTLAPLAAEAMDTALAGGSGNVRWTNVVPDGFTLHADPDQLLRILLNLGRNAVQALGKRPDATVELVATENASGTIIDIIDNGPGLPAMVRERLFEPFSSRGNAGGTGLGLAIARELARAHGGEVALLRSDAGGTAFRITLPNALVEEAAPA